MDIGHEIGNSGLGNRRTYPVYALGVAFKLDGMANKRSQRF